MPSSFSTLVPTFKATEQQQESRINGMSPQDMALLKARDPFMYFSIPAVRKAALLSKDVDNTEASISEEGNQSQVVKRQSRLSVEGHSAQIYEDIFGLTSDGSVTSADSEDEEDDVYSFLALIHRATPSQPTGSSSFGNVTVPTFSEETAKTQQINTKDLWSQDLEALKESDPFLYYSIPVVRESAVLNKTDINLPSNMEVKRHSRHSFECHGDLLLEELIEEMARENPDGNEGGDDDEDMFLSFLESHVSRMQNGQE